MDMGNKLLFDEQPIVIQPTLRRVFGTDEAIFLQQLHYFLRTSKLERDGKKWVYNTYEEWAEILAMNSVITTKRMILKLEKTGVVISGMYNVVNWDKTKWYTLDYNKLKEIVDDYTTHEKKQNIECIKLIQGTYQNDPFRTYQNDPTNTKEKINNKYSIVQDGQNELSESNKGEDGTSASMATKEELTEDFEELWALYPRKERKKDAYKAYLKAIKSGVSKKQIHDGILAYKKHLARNNTPQKYIKMGGTWFSQECWNDEYSENIDVTTTEKTKPKESFEAKMTRMYGENWRVLTD